MLIGTVWRCLLLWMASILDASTAFSSQLLVPLCTRSANGRTKSRRMHQRTQSPSNFAKTRICVLSAKSEQGGNAPYHETYQYNCDVSKNVLMQTSRSLLQKCRRNGKVSEEQQEERFRFPYDTNILELTGNQAASTATTGIILIHPIGVGIGKWFYNRLLESLYDQYTFRPESDGSNKNYLVAIPDLLGSGTASNPTRIDSASSQTTVKPFPLLTVQDWSTQISQLMVHLEADFPRIDHWCVVANGGCSPIALRVAQESVEAGHTRSFQRPVTNVILSSVPRLPFFLPPNDGDESRQKRFHKVQQAYKRLCGILGRLFWWYALRRNGTFIRKFSEKNLVADPDNLGEDWVPNCVATARMYNGNSRYSTFSFLAGSLQAEGCRDSLAALERNNDTVKVDIIRGRDRRRNQAKSWFWQKPKQNQPSTEVETLQQVLERNGNGGRVLECGGRVSLAYEDAPGYANAIMEILE